MGRFQYAALDEEFPTCNREFKYLRFELPFEPDAQCPASTMTSTSSVTGAFHGSTSTPSSSDPAGFVRFEFKMEEARCSVSSHVTHELTLTDEDRGHRRRGRPKGVKDARPRTRRTRQEMVSHRNSAKLSAPRCSPCIGASAWASLPKGASTWASLPKAVLARIFHFVSFDAMLSCVCTSWRNVLCSNKLAVASKLHSTRHEADSNS